MKWQHWGWLVILWLCAWAMIHNTPSSDSQYYYENAARIAQGQGYDPDAYFPIGYPGAVGIVFAITGVSTRAAYFFNAFLYLGIICLTYQLSRQWFENQPFIAVLAAALTTFYLGFVGYIPILNSEILFTFLLLAGVFYLRQPRWIGLAGLAFGLAVLVKPQVLFLPVLLLLITYRPKESLLKTALVYGVMLLVISPWIYQVSRHFDRFVLISTNGGINFFMGNNPNADGSYLEDVVYPTLAEMGYVTRGDSSQVDQTFRRAAIDYIVEQPGAALTLLPRKTFYFFRDEVSAFTSYERYPSPLLYGLMGIAQLQYMVVLVLALLSLRHNVPLTGFVILGYLLLLTLAFFGAGRFRLPAMPLMTIYAAAWITKIRRHNSE